MFFSKPIHIKDGVIFVISNGKSDDEPVNGRVPLLLKISTLCKKQMSRLKYTRKQSVITNYQPTTIIADHVAIRQN